MQYTQKSISLERNKKVTQILESRQKTGPKAEKKGEDRMSNRTRQNNQNIALTIIITSFFNFLSAQHIQSCKLAALYKGRS